MYATTVMFQSYYVNKTLIYLCCYVINIFGFRLGCRLQFLTAVTVSRVHCGGKQQCDTKKVCFMCRPI